MVLKVMFSLIFYLALLNKNVNSIAPVNLPINNPAFDDSFYLDQLDPVLCERQLTLLMNNTLVLVQFLESGLRIPRSITTGNIVDLGNYHQCLDINTIIEETEIQGKYCKISVPANQSLVVPITSVEEFSEGTEAESLKWITNPNSLQLSEEAKENLILFQSLKSDLLITRTVPDSLQTVEFTLAVCVPKVCTTQEWLGSLASTTGIAFQYEDLSCRLPDDKPWVPGDYVAITIFSLIGLITIISTSYDLHSTFVAKKDPKSISTIGRSFSIYTNTRRLLTFTSNPGSLECIDGIRAIAMLWVILGHTFYTFPPTINNLDVLDFISSYRSVWLTSAPNTVDTFFAMSGLLLVYTTVGKFSGKKLLSNLHLFYLNRLLRMFPLLAALILCQISILHRIIDGPLWELIAFQTNACRVNWWATLLYIQNIVSVGSNANICIGHSWYLAIDMQLHIVSPIVLYWVLSKKKKTSWIALTASLLLILSASTTYNFIQKFPGSSFATARQSESLYYTQYYYLNTLARGSSFFVGMVFGYLIHSCRGKKLEISKGTAAIIWLSTFVMTTACIFCVEPMKSADWDNQTFDSLVNSFMRPIWATAIGTIIFLCVTGFGGPINWILSLQIWKLPSRLSYAMYLFHFPIMCVITSSYLSPINFTVLHGFYLFLSQFAITFIISFVMTLIFDSPFSTIFKILLGGGLKKPKVEQESKTDDKQP